MRSAAPTTSVSPTASAAATVALVATVVALGLRPPAVSAQNWDAVEIRAERITEGVYMLVGQGGNIGLSVGADGVFVVDDQFAPLTDKILEAIRRITPEPVRFVFNTHWHGDHTGGNENMGRAGALLVAHENVRERLSVEQVLERIGRPAASYPPAPEGALPVVTFTEDVTFHLNGDELHAFHVSHAHTDGDAIVHFRRANVVHMGDTFFRDRLPFIDTATGGSIDGLIAAVGAALSVMDADTRVIPGHGPLSSRADLQAYRDALRTMRDAVAALKRAGGTLDEAVAARPIRAQAESWGEGEAAEANFVRTIWAGLSGR